MAIRGSAPVTLAKLAGGRESDKPMKRQLPRQCVPGGGFRALQAKQMSTLERIGIVKRVLNGGGVASMFASAAMYRSEVNKYSGNLGYRYRLVPPRGGAYHLLRIICGGEAYSSAVAAMKLELCSVAVGV